MLTQIFYRLLQFLFNIFINSGYFNINIFRDKIINV